MSADDRANGLPGEFGPGVDQGDDVHLPGVVPLPSERFERDASIAKDVLKYDCINTKAKIWFTFLSEKTCFRVTPCGPWAFPFWAVISAPGFFPVSFLELEQRKSLFQPAPVFQDQGLVGVAALQTKLSLLPSSRQSASAFLCSAKTSSSRPRRATARSSRLRARRRASAMGKKRLSSGGPDPLARHYRNTSR